MVKPKRVVAVVTGTVITSVTDLKTGSINGTIIPGRDIKLSGAKLKKVDSSDLVVNNSSKLIAVILSLAAGTYRVRIITQ